MKAYCTSAQTFLDGCHAPVIEYQFDLHPEALPHRCRVYSASVKVCVDQKLAPAFIVGQAYPIAEVIASIDLKEQPAP